MRKITANLHFHIGEILYRPHLGPDCDIVCLILQGIEFLDMVLEWLEELKVNEEVKDAELESLKVNEEVKDAELESLKVNEEVKDAELESWLQLLLGLVDIAGDNPAQYLNHFIKGREKITRKYKLVAQNHVCVPQGWCFNKDNYFPFLLQNQK